MRVWLAHAVDKPTDQDRSAEHGIAADRCAREIVRFLKVSSSALAAAECHTVRPSGIKLVSASNLAFFALDKLYQSWYDISSYL